MPTLPAVAMAACVFAFPAMAQSVLEEVTVTAQKREQNLQDVGISVTAFDGRQLEQLGVISSVDITQQVPAMQLQTFTPAFTIINLRGISQNSFQDNLEAPVAVYVDGAYVPSMNAIHGQLFDVDRLEVLRGPQGTLFGRNATGGLIHYLTRGAADDVANGYLRGQAGEFSMLALEGAVGGSLGDGVRGRLAGRWEENDGYARSVVPGIRDSHGANGYTLRGSMQFDLSDTAILDLRLTRSKDDDVPSGTYSINFATFDPQTGFGVPTPGRLTDELKHASTLEGSFSRDTTMATARLDWMLPGGVDVTSISSYIDLDKDYIEDAGGGLFFFPYENNSKFESFSQEVRLSRSAGSLRWQAGVYYLDMHTDNDQNLRGATVLESLGAVSDSAVNFSEAVLDSRNWSVFGQLEYDVGERVTLIAGLRWSDDKKSIDYVQLYEELDVGIPLTQRFDIATAGVPGLDAIDYEDYAARLQVNYTTASGTLLYAAFNRGIKGGNWSVDPLGSVGAIDPRNIRHDEEVLHAYEMGIKTELSDWSRLNASLYYYDYDDFQSFSLAGLTPQVSNSDAESHGGEIELSLFPVAGLDILLGAAWIDSRVAAVPDVFGGTVEAEFPNAPTLSINALARYEWGALGGRMSAQIDGNWNDDQFIEASNSQISAEDAYLVWNARLAYEAADASWDVAAWVRNAGDAVYRLYNLDLGLFGLSEEVYAPPQWYGATFTYRF